MPGFFITNSNKPIDALENHTSQMCTAEEINFNGFKILRNTLSKFLDDKAFFETDNYIIITEGVLLNKQELKNKYGAFSTKELLCKLIAQYGETFFSVFKGSFSGAAYFKQENKWVVFTNQTGEKQVFYYAEDGVFIAASQVDYVLSQLRKDSRPITLDAQAVYSMYAYMYVYGEHTYANEIHRILPGHYIVIDKSGRIKKNQYHCFDRNKYDTGKLSDDEIIKELNTRLENAVRLEFDKDIEYGYKHLADMSGGFDCRMTSWIARELGYNNILNIHYSQNGSADELVSKKICYALKNQLMTMSLSDIAFVFDADINTEMLYGLSMYCSSTGANRMLKNIRFEDYGLEHTGMLGDVILGTFLDGVHDVKEIKPRKVISGKLID